MILKKKQKCFNDAFIRHQSTEEIIKKSQF